MLVFPKNYSSNQFYSFIDTNKVKGTPKCIIFYSNNPGTLTSPLLQDRSAALTSTLDPTVTNLNTTLYSNSGSMDAIVFFPLCTSDSGNSSSIDVNYKIGTGFYVNSSTSGTSQHTTYINYRSSQSQLAQLYYDFDNGNYTPHLFTKSNQGDLNVDSNTSNPSVSTVQQSNPSAADISKPDPAEWIF
jgi:hypothetical protein